MPMQSRVEKSMAGDAPWLVLSPHLDDAVLSCGALLEAQAREREIIVVTLFTEAQTATHTRAARSFLRQCTVADAGELFEARKSEDLAVLEAMGVQAIHLGEADALFRRRRKPPMVGSSAWDRLLPELTHRYPTYRFDIAKGRIATGDQALIHRLQVAVAGLISQTQAELLFCPAGVGKHVDHLITRAVGLGHLHNVVMYSDFPYDVAAAPDQRKMSRMGFMPWTWDTGLDTKPARISQYATQVDALFPGRKIPQKPETYFVPRPG
ncbi:PIG-L deacetylase family protein [Paenarthrobacter sp. JL.01a]|uniref:PIG-L deacetylase family protein n=1 Tax=Paenarthrobacter sp. JL.01a TaxID=2979324 RepID=UPI0021C76D06|nr:PIG-L family deacetylase [Paenarthrobacter sp. JL.01a]UXM90816.1 PIG-L family deacetylase [Paenarthrobacter sp. JL.01a]